MLPTKTFGSFHKTPTLYVFFSHAAAPGNVFDRLHDNWRLENEMKNAEEQILRINGIDAPGTQDMYCSKTEGSWANHTNMTMFDVKTCLRPNGQRSEISCFEPCLGTAAPRSYGHLAEPVPRLIRASAFHPAAVCPQQTLFSSTEIIALDIVIFISWILELFVCETLFGCGRIWLWSCCCISLERWPPRTWATSR